MQCLIFRPMRILLGVHQFLPEFYFGTEVLTLSLAKAIQNLGHEVVVFSGWPEHLPQRVADGNHTQQYVVGDVPVVRSARATSLPKGLSRIERHYVAPELSAPFEDLLTRFRPDVVHFIHLQNLAFSLVESAAERHIPVFLTATDYWLACPMGLMSFGDGATCSGPLPDQSNCVQHYASFGEGILGSITRRLPLRAIAGGLHIASLPVLSSMPKLREAVALQARARAALKTINLADSIFVPTAYLARVLRDIGVPGERIVKLSYGIDQSSFSQCTQVLGEYPRIRFGFIGSMTEHKGARLLVNSFRQIPPDVRATLTVFGFNEATQYGASLRTAAGSDDRILFRPPFNPDEIAAVLSEVDVLVVPSLWPENAPLVVLSAQAAGRPVIASDVPGLSDLITSDRNGLLFTANDEAQLARVLIHCATRPEEIKRLAEQSVPLKNVEQMARELMEHYDSAIRRRAG